MKTPPVIVWFRQDLRLNDNPALYHAAKLKQPIIFIYIYDKSLKLPLGGASKWWLHHSLLALEISLAKKYNAKLIFAQGNPQEILHSLINKTKATHLFWNRLYEPHLIERDKKIKLDFSEGENAIEVQTFNSFLLREPWQIASKSKTPFKVFTPFWRRLQQEEFRELFIAPKTIALYSQSLPSLCVSKILPLPKIHWYEEIAEFWTIGEMQAKQNLGHFLKDKLKNYSAHRNFPNLDGTSLLSPHLHFGEISPNQIWNATQYYAEAHPSLKQESLKFLSEIAWREFSYHLLYYFPELPTKAFKPAFNHFPWMANKKFLKCWQKGQTGYPIVDAGMRQLWKIGWMHNRVRMITASFLIKDLLITWQTGHDWFWDTLVDADLGNNAASWQWVAGSGADASPYFRIFNPTLQSKKFDKNGEYIRKWVPELKNLESKYIHAPWEAPSDILKKAGITLGKNYPHPIVEHNKVRKVALAAYKEIKNIKEIIN